MFKYVSGEYHVDIKGIMMPDKTVLEVEGIDADQIDGIILDMAERNDGFLPLEQLFAAVQVDNYNNDAEVYYTGIEYCEHMGNYDYRGKAVQIYINSYDEGHEPLRSYIFYCRR